MEETVQCGLEWDFAPSRITKRKDEKTEGIIELKKTLV